MNGKARKMRRKAGENQLWDEQAAALAAMENFVVARETCFLLSFFFRHFCVLFIFCVFVILIYLLCEGEGCKSTPESFLLYLFSLLTSFHLTRSSLAPPSFAVSFFLSSKLESSLLSSKSVMNWSHFGQSGGFILLSVLLFLSPFPLPASLLFFLSPLSFLLFFLLAPLLPVFAALLLSLLSSFILCV